jgi:hypothetical protein
LAAPPAASPAKLSNRLSAGDRFRLDGGRAQVQGRPTSAKDADFEEAWMTFRKSDDLANLAATRHILGELVKLLPEARAAALRLEAAGYEGADLVRSWLEETWPTDDRAFGEGTLAAGIDAFEMMATAQSDTMVVDWLVNVRAEHSA